MSVKRPKFLPIEREVWGRETDRERRVDQEIKKTQHMLMNNQATLLRLSI